MSNTSQGSCEITINGTSGSAIGCVVAASDAQLATWIAQHHPDSKSITNSVIAAIRYDFSRIAILQHLHVDEAARDLSDLLDNFLSEAQRLGAHALLLIADTHEETASTLALWYRQSRFEVIFGTRSGPLLCLTIRTPT